MVSQPALGPAVPFGLERELHFVISSLSAPVQIASAQLCQFDGANPDTVHMEAIGAIASVAGIITAASEAIKVLGPFVTATKDAPKMATQVLSEVLAVKTIVTALEQFAATLSSGSGAPRIKYASLVQVDQLLAVLTDGVLIFSELDALLQTLPPPALSGSRARLLSSMQWVRKKGALATICERLQAFKLSINCILSILQSDSQVRAEDHQRQLMSNMDALLQSSQALAQLFLAADVNPSSFVNQPRQRATWQSSASQDVPDGSAGPPPARNRRSLFELSFEKDLKASRVYRRIKRDTMDFSMRSSVARSHGWSIFSGMSLSDISEISVLALPLHPTDISNPQHYISEPGNLSVLPTSVYVKSIFHECIQVETQLSQLTLCFFKPIIARHRSSAAPEKSDPLSILISVFRQGHLLLVLYNQLDASLAERWEGFLSIPNGDKLAVVEFIQACATRQGIPTEDLFTVTDLMDDDTTGHVKVINAFTLSHQRRAADVTLL